MIGGTLPTDINNNNNHGGLGTSSSKLPVDTGAGAAEQSQSMDWEPNPAPELLQSAVAMHESSLGTWATAPAVDCLGVGMDLDLDAAGP